MEIIKGKKIDFGGQVGINEILKIDNKTCGGGHLKSKQLSFLEPLEPMGKGKIYRI